MRQARSSSLPSGPSAARTCQACWRKARNGRTGDQGSIYSDCWYCVRCWGLWEQNEGPLKLCRDYDGRCRRDGCPYLRCSTGATAFCCWECGSGKERSRAHDSWCERRHWDANPSLGPRGGGGPGDAADAAGGQASTLSAADERLDAVVRGLERSRSLLQRPLSYIVVRDAPGYPPYAVVRGAPHAGAREVGRLPHGVAVSGFPSLGWLHLGTGGAELDGPGGPEERGEQWVFIGRQLAACCLRTNVKGRRAGRLEVEWAGVPSASATYSVDWELGSARESATAGARSIRSMLVSRPEAAIADIPVGHAIRLRVVAFLAGPDADGTGKGTMRVFGPWLETAAEGPADVRHCPGDETRTGTEESPHEHLAVLGSGVEATRGAPGEGDIAGEAAPIMADTPPRLDGATAPGDGAAHSMVGGCRVPAFQTAELLSSVGMGEPHTLLPTAQRLQQEVASQKNIGAPDPLEERAQLRNACGRKGSVRDLVKSFEAKHALVARGRLEPRARPSLRGVAAGGLAAAE